MGGPVMHVLVVCSVLVVAISLERLFALRAGAVGPRKLARALQERAAACDSRGALTLCGESRTPLASLARIGVEELQSGDLRSAELAVEAAASGEAARLSRNLSLLAALANLATLLGLLGTVLGMIEAFEMIALQGSGDASIVASGIFRALVTTAAGLSVGITAFAIHALFKRRVETWLERLEDDPLEPAPHARRRRSRGARRVAHRGGGGLMRFAREAEADGGMGLTPLVDVVFLLLIFFVVATSFREPHLAVNLPDVTQAASSEDAETLLVELHADGGVFVDGEAAAEETLGELFALRAPDVDGLELRADESVPHGRVVEVLDRARTHDLTEIAIAVEAKRPSE